ncbi:OmpA family protein [Aquimarina sp. MMG016]|uniref:OmpA family protein n=1 Tax=Aquimarina sp. MMG016 TaxID=2822690 RepID=UPI001B3A5C6E|nr:OmpA family protein [Aquimarina sp. MMG016]MBQ4822859.1 OmpA family protein [Aquimarina sp. MMG016]
MGELLLRSSLVLTMFFMGNFSFSQEKDLEKAKKQYDRYEYISAQETYLKVVEKGYESADLFKNLGNSYYFNSQFEEALNWYEKLVNSYPDEVEPEYYFRYAQTLKTLGDYEESNTYMQKFAESNKDDQRAQLFESGSDYLDRIDFQSGRFEISNSDVNSEFSDFGTAFYGDYIVFSSSRDTLILKRNMHQWNDQAFLELFVSKYDATNGTLSESKKIGSKINSRFHESTAVFTKDGKTIYFTRNNFDKERRYRTDNKGTNRLKIYRAYKNELGQWSSPKSLSFNSNEYSIAHPALSIDEKTLYFSSDMPGGKGMSDIYSVDINADGSFGEPKNLGNRINTGGKETFPFVSKDNDLYFSSDGHLGLGGLDVYVTRLDPKTKEEQLVVNIGKPINGPKDDFAFILDTNSKRGFFSSNRDGGKGSDDIYGFLQLEDLKNFCEITITGVVSDKHTGEPATGAKIILFDNEFNILDTIEVGEDGLYTFSEKVECETKYYIRAEKEEYNTLEQSIETPNQTQQLNIPLTIENKIKSAEVGDDLAEILSLNSIYFDFNESYIRSDAAIELAKVIEVMIQYPQMKIDVRSHTDSHGDDVYNLYLSEERAKATIKYMIGKGIAADRLSGKGYGETEPVNNCGNDTNCTKDDYQLNRRSEFIIVK